MHQLINHGDITAVVFSSRRDTTDTTEFKIQNTFRGFDHQTTKLTKRRKIRRLWIRFRFRGIQLGTINALSIKSLVLCPG